MEELLDTNPPLAAAENGTDGRKRVLLAGDKCVVPPLMATPRFPSRFTTAIVCFIARASSILVCTRFFDCIRSVLLTYNARYLSSYSLGIETVQMAISPNLIFNTWQIARD
jgi:hypothetical protein